MKKLLLLVACLIMMGGIHAQVNIHAQGSIPAQQHLTFKGVPIDGTLQNYVDAMKQAGFHYEGTTDDGTALLSGDFAGYKNCYIGISTLSNCDVVSQIAVLFPSNSTWSALLSDYEHLKEMMTKKYGRPKECQERFTGYVGDSGDLRLLALSKGEYEWFTKYETDLGTIVLTIGEGTEYSTGSAVLVYRDALNAEKVSNSAIDDL